MGPRGKASEGHPCNVHMGLRIETHGGVHPFRGEDVRSVRLEPHSGLLDEGEEAFGGNEAVVDPYSDREVEEDLRRHGTHSDEEVEVPVVLRASLALHRGLGLDKDTDQVGSDLRCGCLKKLITNDENFTSSPI